MLQNDKNPHQSIKLQLNCRYAKCHANNHKVLAISLLKINWSIECFIEFCFTCVNIKILLDITVELNKRYLK